MVEQRTAEQVLDEYRMLEPFPVANELLGILRRVLELHHDDGGGWCAGCAAASNGYEPPSSDACRIRDCPTRAAFLAAEPEPEFDRPAQAAQNPDAEPRLVVVEWEDTVNIAEWSTMEEVEEFARKGGWRVVNVGWLLYEDDECVVLAARVAPLVEPPQTGLYERIPKRAITSRRTIQTAGAWPAGMQWDGVIDGRKATEAEAH